MAGNLTSVSPAKNRLATWQVTVSLRPLERCMINVFRKHQKWLMIVIAILAMPFCLYFVRTDWWTALRGEGEGTRLYGQTIPRLELDRGGRLFDLARLLGMNDFLNDILAQWRPQRAKTQSEAEREAGQEF